MQQITSPDKLERLWTAATWRDPWRQSVPLFVPVSNMELDLKLASETLGLELLSSLPRELKAAI
ncbi:hypothetical protein HJFPF1_11046 [Paramyrothecium foliicola]|nr:hypothetical protein HJFPF1_11046 [Paramyrothecium foliicola]